MVLLAKHFMSLLLRKVKANPLRSVELIPAVLEIYDDKIVFRDKGLLSRKESTISYKQVSQVSINKGLVHSTLEIVNTGGYKNIKLEHVKNKLAIEAQKAIEEYTNMAQTQNIPTPNTSPTPSERINTLQQLLDQGFIDKEEFEQKRRAIIAEV